MNQNNGDFSLDDIYFKDCFTQTQNEMELEVDNATIKSLTSKNNTFSLDTNGNLVVNSITTNGVSGLFNLIYPVGSIYLSTNNINPSTIFGGTWEAFGTGRTLVGIDTNQTEFNSVEKTGGEKTHTLSEAEMPSHNHTGTTDGNGNHAHQVGGDWDVRPGGNYTSVHNAGYPGNSTNPWTSTNGWHDHTFTTSSKGSGNAHNNLQPYITCYMWKRTA